jgi:hypothetical protein
VVCGSVPQSEVGGGVAPAAELWRCYDFQCQELATDFLGFHDVFVLGASEKPEPVNPTVDPAAIRGFHTT